MAAFTALLKMNIRRRLCDGFVVGYNMIFPIIITLREKRQKRTIWAQS